MFVLSVWMVAGCWSGAEQERARRVWEMQDHETSTIAARDALLRGDLPGARTAGEELARQDPVPGLPEGARGHLDAVRAAGQRLAQAADPATAASEVLGLTVHCAACHESLGVEVVRPMRDAPREHLWLGLVFEDEASWAKGVSGLPGVAGLDTTTAWPDRRAALAPLLESGAL